MKQFLSHFKFSFILGALIIAFAPLTTSDMLASHRQKSLSDYVEETETEVDPTEPPIEDPDLPPPADTFTPDSDLIIKAINPGYKIDGISDVGELIELQNLTDASLSLAGFSLRYTNSSGNSTIIISFPDGSLMAGEYLLAKYTKSPDSELSDLVYTTSLAMSAGPLELLYEDEVVDSVCWNGKGDCAKAFKSANPTTLVRNLDTNTFAHEVEYTPHFDASHSVLILPPSEDEPSEEGTKPNTAPTTPAAPATSQCRGLEFTEVYSYYAKDKAEQFIELYNPTDHEIALSGCQLRYKKKNYPLSGSIGSNQYYAYYPNGNFSLTKNPTTSNTVELIDADEKVVDELVYVHGQKKSTSYARFFDQKGEEMWAQTYNITPNQSNIYQEFRSCPTGKVINPATGNCVNATTIQEKTQECPAGKYRNPLTGRCKNIESASTQKPCAKGYERNPETNRCRKIKSDNDGAGYALVPSTRSDRTTFVALGVVIILVACGVLYIILQFRRELARTFRKVRQRTNNLIQNLFTREGRRHRNKKP